MLVCRLPARGSAPRASARSAKHGAVHTDGRATRAWGVGRLRVPQRGARHGVRAAVLVPCISGGRRNLACACACVLGQVLLPGRGARSCTSRTTRHVAPNSLAQHGRPTWPQRLAFRTPAGRIGCYNHPPFSTTRGTWHIQHAADTRVALTRTHGRCCRRWRGRRQHPPTPNLPLPLPRGFRGHSH